VALLAEEIVEEWLNREGYFAMRRIKLGVQEMGLLDRYVQRPEDLECPTLKCERRFGPSAMSPAYPKLSSRQRAARPAAPKHARSEELRHGIIEWITKKYDHPKKQRVRNQLAPRPWSRELVIHA
jgi:hypothetical protein